LLLARWQAGICRLAGAARYHPGKEPWAQFKPRFGTQESRKALNVKFEQLAELRNGILHSRALSEVLRKEGEAAILWFRQVLTKMIRSNVDHEGGDYFIKVGWH
jgi:hypothetical protein